MVGREAMRKATRSALQLFTEQPIGYVPEAQGSLLRRGATRCTYAVRVPASGVPYVPRTVWCTTGEQWAQLAQWLAACPVRYAGLEPRTIRLGPRTTNRPATHTCGHFRAQAWQQRELMPMYFPMFEP
eukprot:scaffold93421_cov51-Phaeocystis_antarctica.AAC.1